MVTPAKAGVQINHKRLITLDSGPISFGNLFGSAKPSGRNDGNKCSATFYETINCQIYQKWPLISMNKQQRILIVDDNTVFREVLKSVLSHSLIFDIVGEATDGTEALESVEILHPDLVLMDISMPRMNGITATGEIKKKRPVTKVLIVSTYKNHEYMTAALKAGADGYLSKDSTEGELIQSIEDILAGNKDLHPNTMESVSI